jgi:hypothetical protein
VVGAVPARFRKRCSGGNENEGKKPAAKGRSIFLFCGELEIWNVE